MKTYCLRMYELMQASMLLIELSKSPPPPARFTRLMRWIERRYHLT
jgi:hypothetical protein